MSFAVDEDRGFWLGHGLNGNGVLRGQENNRELQRKRKLISAVGS